MTARARLRVSDQRGFTLTELLVTVAILGLIMSAVITVQLTSNTIFNAGEDQAVAQQAARAAMLMEEDLRLIGTGVPTGLAKITASSATSITFLGDLTGASTYLTVAAAPGNNTLTVANASGILAGDRIDIINGNQTEGFTVNSVAGNVVTLNTPVVSTYAPGVPVGRYKTVVCQFANGTLSKDAGTGAGLQTLATGLQSVQFSYFDVSNNPTTVSASIAAIQVTTTATSASTSHTTQAFRVTSNVRPRNL